MPPRAHHLHAVSVPGLSPRRRRSKFPLLDSLQIASVTVAECHYACRGPYGTCCMSSSHAAHVKLCELFLKKIGLSPLQSILATVLLRASLQPSIDCRGTRLSMRTSSGNRRGRTCGQVSPLTAQRLASAPRFPACSTTPRTCRTYRSSTCLRAIGRRSRGKPWAR